MSRIEELQEQVKQLTSVLAQMGVIIPKSAPTNGKMPDFIEFGSEQHAAFLGLVRVDENNTGDYITHTGQSGVTYRLEDEVTQFMNYPDPKQVAKLVLRQKINELESGAPPIFDGAPPLWMPGGYGGM